MRFTGFAYNIRDSACDAEWCIPMKPVILTFTAHYLPGYKAGGPLRTIANLVEWLGDEFLFKIVTSDRDFQDQSPYPNLVADQWLQVGKAQVIYRSGSQQTIAATRRLMQSTKHDMLYLNSVWNVRCSTLPLLLNRFKMAPQHPVVVAPRGDLSAGALSIKAYKKRPFLALMKKFDLYRDVIWQASSPAERQNILNSVGPLARILIAPNLPAPAPIASQPLRKTAPKKPGELRMVFLSRIVPMKNLDGALRILAGIDGRITFSVYGPQEDREYYNKCLRLARELADNVTVEFLGPVVHQEVGKVLAEHDLFFLPTLGENFGHIILEAMSAGCPVLISDRTPWRNLADKGVGWDVPLEEPDVFQAIIQRCVDMDDREMSTMSARASEFALARTSDGAALDSNVKLFELASSKAGKTNGGTSMKPSEIQGTD